jgi:hypothetical protein
VAEVQQAVDAQLGRTTIADLLAAVARREQERMSATR